MRILDNSVITISTIHLNDKNLSCLATTVLSLMLTRSNETIKSDELIHLKSDLDEETLETAINELKAAGYISINEDLYSVYENPAENPLHYAMSTLPKFENKDSIYIPEGLIHQKISKECILLFSSILTSCSQKPVSEFIVKIKNTSTEEISHKFHCDKSKANSIRNELFSLIPRLKTILPPFILDNKKTVTGCD